MLLVTGGAGFIGSNIIAKLRADQPIVVCDALGDDARWKNLARQSLHDIIHPDALPDWLLGHAKDLTGIIHMGAISATTERDVDKIIRNNLALSRRLWHVAVARDIPFIYASSASVYGDGGQGFSDRVDMATLTPLNPYAWSKLLFDKFVTTQKDKPKQWAGLRFFNVYGPNEYHKGGQQSVVAHAFSQIQNDGLVRLFKSHRPDYTDGGQMRDFVWVGDCVDVVLWLLKQPKISGIFNVGTGKARAFKHLAFATFEAMQRAPNIVYNDMPEAIRPHYQYYTQSEQASLVKAGYTAPMTTLEEGVKTYVQQYLMKEWPYA